LRSACAARGNRSHWQCSVSIFRHIRTS
jgi:hypothetical protein